VSEKGVNCHSLKDLDTEM